MNVSSRFATALAASALALSGCLMEQDRAAEAREAEKQNRLFVEKSVASLQETALSQYPDFGGPGAFQNDAIIANLDKLGCPKLANLFRDLLSDSFTPTPAKPFPNSLVEYLACFGINGVPDMDSHDKVFDALDNPTALLDCICGGSGLSDLIAGRISLFSAGQSKVAGETFSAGASSAGGASYSSSGSAGGAGYSSSGSAGGNAFQAQ